MKIIEKMQKWITIIILICGFLLNLIFILDYIKSKDFDDIIIIIFITLIIILIISVIKWLAKIIEKSVNKKVKLSYGDMPNVLEIQEKTSEISKIPAASIAGSKTEFHDKRIKENHKINAYSVSAPSFPSWYVSLSFGKSSSNNYGKAIELAKSAPTYLETNPDGNIIHQAIYSNDKEEFLQFIKLYELVNNWKSSFVIINDQHIDRKIVGQLNYCYGDKCRSGNPSFCYGASYMTENPFGCHRLQISACNHPWWDFYRKVRGKWILDENAMLERINSYATVYRICPDFDYDNIMKAFNKFPRSISDSRYGKLRTQGESSFTIHMKL